MKECLEEYKGYDISTIINCLEPNNHTNKLIGITNDLDDIKYDVFFNAAVPNCNHTIGTFINIEAQKSAKLPYKLHNRALVYIGYEIAYQYNRVFKNQEYDALQKVVSIWICFDAPTKEEQNSITYFSLSKDVKVGYNVVTVEEYDKLLIVIIYLEEESAQNEFLRFLEVLFTSQLTANEKKLILENKYQILVDEKMKEDLKTMCNLADRIEEKALEKGMKIGIEQGIEREKINSVISLMKNLHLTFEEVIKVLDVPDYLVESCREFVIKC